MVLWKLVVYIVFACAILAVLGRHIFRIVGQARTAKLIAREEENAREGSGEDGASQGEDEPPPEEKT